VALLAMVIALGLFGVLATVSHLVGMDRVREAWALRESSAALFAAEAGLASAVALWDTTALESLAPGVTISAGSERLRTGDVYELRITRLDDGSGSVRYYVIESTGRSRGAWRGRRTLGAFVKLGPDEPPGGGLEDAGEPSDEGGAEGAGGSTGMGTELHLPHPLAQFRWLEILE
jgi:hypothetical protein